MANVKDLTQLTSFTKKYKYNLKIAVISDIHGNIPALEEVVADINRKRVDYIINLGDHLSGPLWPKETIQFLMEQDWIQISGNQDRQLVEQDPSNHGLSDSYAYNVLNNIEKEWLHSLQTDFRLDENVFAFHGTPLSDTEYLLETIEHSRARLASREEIKLRLGNIKSPVMLCGHTHIPRIVETDENILIINPGSVGLPAYEDDFPEAHIMESGSPHARYAVLESYNNKWTAEMIAIPYDFERAAEQAHKNNRHDWQIALRTGYMV